MQNTAGKKILQRLNPRKALYLVWPLLRMLV